MATGAPKVILHGGWSDWACAYREYGGQSEIVLSRARLWLRSARARDGAGPYGVVRRFAVRGRANLRCLLHPDWLGEASMLEVKRSRGFGRLRLLRRRKPLLGMTTSWEEGCLAMSVSTAAQVGQLNAGHCERMRSNLVFAGSQRSGSAPAGCSVLEQLPLCAQPVLNCAAALAGLVYFVSTQGNSLVRYDFHGDDRCVGALCRRRPFGEIT